MRGTVAKRIGNVDYLRHPDVSRRAWIKAVKRWWKTVPHHRKRLTRI